MNRVDPGSPKSPSRRWDSVPVNARRPIEPPPTRWLFGDHGEWDREDDLVAMGADLEPGTLLAAYRLGLFPMPSGGPEDPMGWFSPVHRGVLPLDALKVSRSMRRSAREMEIRVDTDFAQVIDACANPERSGGWIDSAIRAAYLRLHELGWAHSVEAWRDGEMVGGLYGVAVGGLFAGESMFHRVSDASKVALMGLVDVMLDGQDVDREPRLIDVQWETPHLASLGVVAWPRPTYLRTLPYLIAARGPRWEAPLRVPRGSD